MGLILLPDEDLMGERLDWVTDRLALGMNPRTRAHFEQLARMGITEVLDVQEAPPPDGLWKGTGLTVTWAGSDDDGAPRTERWCAQVVAWGLAHASAAPATKTYVHCHAGMNRSPAAAYLVLRTALGLSADCARYAVLTARKVAGPRYFADLERWLGSRGGHALACWWCHRTGRKSTGEPCSRCLGTLRVEVPLHDPGCPLCEGAIVDFCCTACGWSAYCTECGGPMVGDPSEGPTRCGDCGAFAVTTQAVRAEAPV